MSVNLITGYAGEVHVTSADDGAVNAGVIGSGKYVLNIGQKFAYETISNNLIRIKDGYMINQGRKIGIKINDYEDVTIDNGLQSVKRSDLIVMRYTKNADTGIETAEIVVIKGTSGDSYVDPEHTTGDILNGDLIDDVLLYRVNLDGLNITSVTALFTISNTIKELEEDINTNKDDIVEVVSGLGKKADTSKNLWKPDWVTTTISGVTFTVNDDKSITVNGTAPEEGVSFYLFGSAATRKIFSNLEAGKIYTFTKGINGVEPTPHFAFAWIYIDYTKDGSGYSWADYGGGWNIEYAGTEEFKISIFVGPYATISNVTFYPMIRKAEITDSTYEQYYPTLKEVGTKLGTTDISAIADGTVTGGISTLNNNLDVTKILLNETYGIWLEYNKFTFRISIQKTWQAFVANTPVNILNLSTYGIILNRNIAKKINLNSGIGTIANSGAVLRLTTDNAKALGEWLYVDETFMM